METDYNKEIALLKERVEELEHEKKLLMQIIELMPKNVKQEIIKHLNEIKPNEE